MIYSIRIFEEFRKQPISSSLVIMANNSMKLPNATLCLPLYIGELDGTQRLRNETFGNITSAEVHYENLTDYFEQESLSKADFLNEIWPNSLLHVVHTYLALLSFCETFDGNSIIVCSDDELNTESNPEIPPWGIDYLAPSRKLLETNLRALNVSVSVLRQSFGSKVAYYFALWAENYVDMYYDDNRTIFTPVALFVGKQQICNELGIDSFSFTFDNKIIIYANKHSLPWVVTESKIAEMKTT